MANLYHIYVGGTYDMKTREYTGATLDATFTTEREAFYREKKLQWEYKEAHMVVEGDERFTIVPIKMNGVLWYDIVDKRTQSYCYGLCQTMENAISEKAWIEKYHYEHWYEEYYNQFKAA